MKVLIGCEFSGVLRNAFRRSGHDAWSCDLLSAEDEDGNPVDPHPRHLKCDVLKVLDMGWDLAIFHPPCTHLAGSGARWLTDHWVTSKAHPEGRYWHDGSEKRKLQKEALEFVLALANAPIPRIAIENPVGMLSSLWRKPDQIFHPYNFGDPFMKKTCLWLKDLPALKYTSNLTSGEQACWKETPSPDRWKKRSLTYPGWARAAAEQWGGFKGPV